MRELFDERRDSYVRRGFGIYPSRTVRIMTPFRGTDLEYALSTDGKIGKSCLKFFGDRDNRRFRGRFGWARWHQRRLNRRARQRDDARLSRDPELDDRFVLVKDWLD